jgi:hypothetical protein
MPRNPFRTAISFNRQSKTMRTIFRLLCSILLLTGVAPTGFAQTLQNETEPNNDFATVNMIAVGTTMTDLPVALHR